MSRAARWVSVGDEGHFVLAQPSTAWLAFEALHLETDLGSDLDPAAARFQPCTGACAAVAAAVAQTSASEAAGNECAAGSGLCARVVVGRLPFPLLGLPVPLIVAVDGGRAC